MTLKHTDIEKGTILIHNIDRNIVVVDGERGNEYSTIERKVLTQPQWITSTGALLGTSDLSKYTLLATRDEFLSAVSKDCLNGNVSKVFMTELMRSAARMNESQFRQLLANDLDDMGLFPWKILFRNAFKYFRRTLEFKVSELHGREHAMVLSNQLLLDWIMIRSVRENLPIELLCEIHFALYEFRQRGSSIDFDALLSKFVTVQCDLSNNGEF